MKWGQIKAAAFIGMTVFIISCANEDGSQTSATPGIGDTCCTKQLKTNSSNSVTPEGAAAVALIDGLDGNLEGDLGENTENVQGASDDNQDQQTAESGADALDKASSSADVSGSSNQFFWAFGNCGKYKQAPSQNSCEGAEVADASKYDESFARVNIGEARPETLTSRGSDTRRDIGNDSRTVSTDRPTTNNERRYDTGPSRTALR